MDGCTCENVSAGSYANQETRPLPFATERYSIPGAKPVGIDRCILPTVEALWADGIETVECCCGHGKATGYIAVKPQHVADMLMRGFLFDDRTNAPATFLWPPSAFWNAIQQ